MFLRDMNCTPQTGIVRNDFAPGPTDRQKIERRDVMTVQWSSGDNHPGWECVAEDEEEDVGGQVCAMMLVGKRAKNIFSSK